MNRALRSHRGNKEEILKQGAIILCKIETENKLFKVIEDWKQTDQKIKVQEMVEQESKKRNKLLFKCEGYIELDISTTKWTELEGAQLHETDELLYTFDEEIVNLAIRSLINEEKHKVEKTQIKYDFEDSEVRPPKKTKKSSVPKEEISAKISENSESSESDASAEAEPVPKKQRQSRKTEEKAAKKGKKKGKKKNEQFRNLQSISLQYDGSDDIFIDYESTRMNNKEIIRAALTGNKTLMEKIFQTKYKLSRLDDEWGPEYDITALEILLAKQDKELLKYFLQNQHQILFTRDLPCQLKEIDTGYNRKEAYGVKLRKVALGRGNREGNNAFVYDLNTQQSKNEKIIKLLQIETDPELFELFFLYYKNENYEHHLIDLVCYAVRCGNIKVAKYLINYAQKNNLEGYGFNYLHNDALGDNFNTYNLEQIKKISITKKTQNDRLITPIHCACINPSEQFLKYFMEQTMEFNIQDENGQKPVHYAAVSQTSNCLQYLLENKVDGREGDKFLTTPLMLAAQYGRAHNVLLLCDTNLKAKNKEGNSAIHLASKNGHKECVKILLEKGVLINFAGKNRMTPLHFASAYNFLELVEFLLDEGARINAKDKFGRTPLIMAVRNGNLAIMSKLLYYGADQTITDSSKNSALHYAAAYGFIDCLQVLIEAGANQNELNSWKLSPLNVALAKNHIKIVKLLLSYENTDVNCIDDDGSTLVACLIKQFNQTQEKFDFIQYLIEEKNANIHIPDKYGKTCLQIAMSGTQSDFQIQLVELLLKKGADIHALDKDGRSCLFHALNGSQTSLQIKLVKLLLSHGANMNSQEKESGTSGFSLCLQKKNYPLLIELLNEGFEPDVDVVNSRQETLIHILINNQFYYSEDGMKLFELILNKINKSLLNHFDSQGYVPMLKLVESFIQSISQQVALDFRNRVEKAKQEVWEKILADFKPKIEELRKNTNEQHEQQLRNQQSYHFQQNAQSNYFSGNQFQSNQNFVTSNIFGNQQPSSQGLFSNLDPNNQQQQQSNFGQNLFSNQSLISINAQPSNSLFGNQNNQSSQPSNSLFGNQNNQTNQPSNSLFGNQNNQTNQPSNSLFGNQNNQTNQPQTQNQLSLNDFWSKKNTQNIIKEEKSFLETEIQSETGLTFDTYQKMIQQLINQCNQTVDSSYFSFENLRVQIGYTLQQQTQFIKLKKEDGYKYQTRILNYLTKLIEMGAKTNKVFIRQNQVLKKKNNSQGCKNIFHIIFRDFRSTSFLEQLLKLFPNKFLHQQDNFGTPLHYFIEQYAPFLNVLERENETIQQFLDYIISLKLNFTQPNKQGNTPVILIALKFSESLRAFLQLLISLGGKINDYNNNNVVPLQYYVEKGNIKMVKLLISDFGADPNFQDKVGRTSLHYAINYSNPNANASFQMEQTLIKAGAKCDIKDQYLRTPLFYAFVKFSDPKNTQEIDPFESVSSLLAHNDCEVKIIDIYERTPLHYAALRGSAISGRYMIKMGAQVDVPDKFNNTPLAYAFFTHANFSTMLIDNKADANKMINIISEADYIKEKRAYYNEIVENDQALDIKIKSAQYKIEQQAYKKKEVVQQQQESLSNSDDSKDSENELARAFGIPSQAIEVERLSFTQIQQTSLIEIENSKEENSVDTKLLEEQKKNVRYRMIQTAIDEKIQQDMDIPQLLHNKMSTGQYSYFSQAIKFGWQGVAYLLISDGYEFIKAIQDAINANQFQLVLTLLMKVKSKDLSRVNEKGQNLFHLFAKYSKSVALELKQEIVYEFEQKNISPYIQDQYLKLPLHYAVENSDEFLTDYFIYQRKCDVNLMDETQNNVFTLILQRDYSKDFSRMVEFGLKADVQFRVLFSNTFIKPFLYLVEVKKTYHTSLLQKLINYGVDVNEQNSQKQTALTIAIKNNNYQFFQFILSQPTFKPEFHAVDDEGKTPIHHVVLPLEFGSYENLQMLKDLIPLFDINAKDNSGQTALDYALIFDAQIMKNELLSCNAYHTRSLRQQRMPTSIIATALWPDQEVDYEEDAQQFSDKSLKLLEVEKDNKTIVDNQAIRAKGDLIVYEDHDLGLFQCLLSKVDIVNRGFHKNVFYKMQILFDSTRKNYILFTKWGQIGEEGQFQMTPFEDLEATVKEYCKIFAAKTGGNNWKQIKSGEVEFEKKPEKYQLMQFKTNLNYKSVLEPFDLSDKSPYPKCNLDSSIQKVIEQFSQVKLFQQELRQYQFDTKFAPIERLDKTLILKAKEYLMDLKQLVKEVHLYEQQTEIELKKVQQYYQEINDKSARYYEIIPQGEMRQNMLPMLETEDAINRQLQLIELLLSVELSVKILLGAHNKLSVIHPLTYCFNALNIKMLTLGKQDLEFKMIQAYVNRTSSAKIKNIFAIERKGEAARFEKYSNGPRILLWHGSKISNYVSLLAMGLKIAPSWAYSTGALYGKGIYFADQFQKSFAYTNDHTVNSGYGYGYGYNSYNRQRDNSLNLHQYKYLLLCEVSCQNQYSLYNIQGQNQEDFHKPEITLKVVGSQGPDENSQIRMPNGCVVPIGNVIQQTLPQHDAFPKISINFCTNQTEYIIYDESRVRIRYLVQIES